MNYFVFMIAYLVSLIIIVVQFYKANKIDISDYENRKDEIKKEVRMVFKNCLFIMLIFNFFSAIAYKLQSFHFLSWNSILAVIFFSLIQTNIITFFYPKTNKLKICSQEKGIITISTISFMCFMLFYISL